MDFEGRKSNDDYPHKTATDNVNKTYPFTAKTLSQCGSSFMNTADFLSSTYQRKLQIYVWEFFEVILVRAKYHNRTSALQKRCSKQLIYYRSHNARGYPVNEFTLQ